LNALDEKPEKLVDKKCYINMEYIGSAWMYTELEINMFFIYILTISCFL
jgi:hypothetical protein